MSLKLLAVDDEADVLKMLQVILELNGCEVVALTDSREAPEQLDREHFDGVFLDGHMPFIDGSQLAEQVRRSKLNAQVPIVMLSGSINEEKGGGAFFTPDVTYFISKPIDPMKLKQVLSALGTRKEEDNQKEQE